MADLVAPQMVINSRMIYFGWIPADPQAAARTIPAGLRPSPSGSCFMNQYVVDSEDQTSGFGAYSLTYNGPDLDRFAPDGETPSRWWVGYLNSSPGVREYVLQRGVPAVPGETTIEIENGVLTATTRAEGVDIIRTVASVGGPSGVWARGQLSYITPIDGKLVDGVYPYTAELVDPFELTSLEFLAKDHPTYDLRPASPLQVVWGFYSPRASFCYPGGEHTLSM